MRITDSQQSLQISQTAAKIAETQQASQTQPTAQTSQSSAKVGDVLNALVADLLEGGLLLNLEGKLVKAEVKNPGDFKLGEQVFLKVIQSSQGQLLVEKVAKDSLQELKAIVPDGALETLKALELPDTPKNRAALEALNAFKLPLTQSNIKSLGLMQNVIEKILNQSSEALAAEPQLKNLAGMNLKDIGAVLQRVAPQTVSPQGTMLEKATDLPIAEPELTDMAQKTVIEVKTAFSDKASAAVNTSLGAVSTERGSASTQTANLPEETPETVSDQLASQTTKKAAESEPPALHERQVRLLLDGLETMKTPKEALKTLAFLMKLDVQATPQSLYAVGQVFNRTQLKSMLNDLLAADGMDQLPEGVKKNLDQVKDLLRQFEPEAFKSQEVIKQLTKKLIEATEQLEISAQKSAANFQDNALSNKSVIDTFKTPNLPFLLSEFPLMINDKLETLELYAEKRNKGKKIDPEDLRIYLSLTTEKLGRVGAMIEIKMKNIAITFDTATEEVKSAIEDHGKDLEERLSPFGYEVAVKAQVKTKPASLRDFHEQFEPISFTRFDKKV